MKYKIGLDVSGGDFAPQEIIKGASLARKEAGADIVLFGVKEEIDREILKYPNLKGIACIDSPEKIEMGESPASSVRRKRQSSIVLAAEALKEGAIDAFVSCGNTGAAVCAASLSLGYIEGLERPGIALMIPTQNGVSMLIDGGANIGPKPLHLLQYGVMASVYYRLVYNKDNPTIGLLNIGEEASKGSEFVKSVHKLFSVSSMNFIGNLEGRDLFSGKCDCIVCDGFIGNVALKVSEGCAEAIFTFLRNLIKKDPLAALGAFLMQRSFRKMKNRLDYAEYGGAPLLGVNGIVIIGHGRSNARAVKNAIKVAEKELERDLNGEIKKRIHEVCQDSRVREELTA